MSYTLGGWVKENALVHVRLPAPNGGTIEAWLPVDVLTGDTGPVPEEYNWRTFQGHEAVDFANWIIGRHEEARG